MKIKIVSKSSKDWNKAANLVTQKYRRTFGADVLPNPDYFWVCASEMSNGNAQIDACMGISFGSPAFFSEQYLDEPIEQILSQLENKSVSRDAIVEVGSLAALNHSVGTELLRILSTIVWSMGKRYILCTATKPLRRIVDRLGLDFESIQISDYRRLGENAKEQWGNYYDKQPETGFIELGSMSRETAECKYDLGRDCWFCTIWDETAGLRTPFHNLFN